MDEADIINNIKRLRSVTLFKDIPVDVLTELAKKVEKRTWEKDEILINKGDPGGSLYVLYSGWVKLVVVEANGEELVLNHCGPGETIGDVALIDGGVHPTGVVALVPIKALELKRDEFLQMINQQPSMAIGILRGLSAKIRLFTTYIEKAIEWSNRVAKGDYTFMDQLDAEHRTIVTMSRPDEARVGEFLAAFFRMAEGVKQREEFLKQQVQELIIKFDEAKRQREVEELTESDFFKKLKSATGRFRKPTKEDL
jgi:CRP/FNR family cyclic AMP-dependent transcriptional regulator